MRKGVSSSILSLTVLLAVGQASAQKRALGERGSFAISAERLAGVFVLDANTDANGVINPPGGDANITTHTTNETDTTAVAVLGNADNVGPAVVPRLALDFFVHPYITVGGSFMYFTSSADSRGQGSGTRAGTSAQLDITETEMRSHTLVFSPRAGSGLMFTDMIGLWGHAGLAYAYMKQKVTSRTIDPVKGDTVTTETTTNKISLFSLPLDVLLLIRPVEAFAFEVGPFLEIPLSGDAKSDQTGPAGMTTADGDLTPWSYGLTIGVIGFL